MPKYAGALARLVLVLVFLFAGSHPVWSQESPAVRLFVYPSTRETILGELTSLELHIDTGGQTINAADLTLQLDPSIASVTGAERRGSVFDFWVQEPQVSTEQGVVRFTGGTSTGFTGEGLIGQIFWRGVRPGTFTIGLSADSSVHLHDGRGTALSHVFSRFEFTVVPSTGLPVVYSETHADEDIWYATSVVRLNWVVHEQKAYSYVVTRNPEELPDEVPDTPIGEIKLSQLDDGIYYFRLREQDATGVWSVAVTRQIKIDTRPPEPFEVRVDQDQALFGGKPFASFVATDVMSGVVSYEVQEGDEVSTLIAPPYLIKGSPKQLRVTAIDRAGNQRVSIYEAPLLSRLWIGLVSVVVVLVLGGLWWYRRRQS